MVVTAVQEPGVLLAVRARSEPMVIRVLMVQVALAVQALTRLL
jgi:hypothetical protein